MEDPKAIGVVLATLVNPAGKPVSGGAARGQLYAGRDELVVVRPAPRAELLQRVTTALLLGSIAAVLVNVFTWRSAAVLWGAVAAQAVYWLTLPARRRALDPEPLDARGLAAARSAGRIAIRVPASAVVRTTAPEPPRSGFRKPARFELTDGALEVYLSPEQHAAIVAAIGLRPAGEAPAGRPS
ncbi:MULTISPECIES: hypothetical protein [Anaeromyxobacter]|uniref:hypothetical protein n=1 Tax=Anaeromyxobacter TaxID=161492 RepID=UPI001F59155C|nr:MULTISPECIES: hypothetical protein [unclassified Anaeromyxobacter]